MVKNRFNKRSFGQMKTNKKKATPTKQGGQPPPRTNGLREQVDITQFEVNNTGRMPSHVKEGPDGRRCVVGVREPLGDEWVDPLHPMDHKPFRLTPGVWRAALQLSGLAGFDDAVLSRYGLGFAAAVERGLRLFPDTTQAMFLSSDEAAKAELARILEVGRDGGFTLTRRAP
jgi:hypothetical protein